MTVRPSLPIGPAQSDVPDGEQTVLYGSLLLSTLSRGSESDDGDFPRIKRAQDVLNELTAMNDPGFNVRADG